MFIEVFLDLLDEGYLTVVAEQVGNLGSCQLEGLCAAFGHNICDMQQIAKLLVGSLDVLVFL